MAGLLGDTDWTDPANQGLLQFGLSMLAGSGPSTKRTSVGQLIGLAGGQGMDAFNVARRQKLLEQESRRRDELAQAQLQEILAQAEEKKARLAEQQRLQQVLSGALSPISQAEALTAGGGPTNTAADLVGQRKPVNYQALIAQGIPPSIVEALAKSQDYGKQTVARTVEADDGRGGKVTVQLDQFGRPVGDQIPGYVPPQLANLGNEYRWVSPREGQSYSVGMSPTEQDASRNRWANFGLSQQRLALDQQNSDLKQNAPQKPLPPTALKIQADALDKIGVSSSINADVNALIKQIDNGSLSFGPVQNLTNRARNYAGNSTPESRNFADFMASMERLRNESLRLNTGVQTEGDAQRAWNELFQSINDKTLVRQNLQRISALNKRAADLKKLELDQVRANYGYEPMDYSRFETLPTSVNRGGAGGDWGAPAGSGFKFLGKE